MSRADLVTAIERAKHRARAEQHLKIADPKANNPWSGAGKELLALEKQLQAEDERDEALRFHEVMQRYIADRNTAESQALRESLRAIEDELASIGPALPQRWERLKFNTDAAQFVRGLEMRLNSDPEASLDDVKNDFFGFTRDEIRAVARYRHLDGERRSLGSQLHGALLTYQQLEREHPALADIPRETITA